MAVKAVAAGTTVVAAVHLDIVRATAPIITTVTAADMVIGMAIMGMVDITADMAEIMVTTVGATCPEVVAVMAAMQVLALDRAKPDMVGRAGVARTEEGTNISRWIRIWRRSIPPLVLKETRETFV